MAQFRATIQGSRGEGSRLGDKNSGICTNTNGWSGGVNVNGSYHERTDEDIFNIYATSGSGYGHGDGYVGMVIRGFFFLKGNKFRGKKCEYRCPNCNEEKVIRDEINDLCRVCFKKFTED